MSKTMSGRTIIPVSLLSIIHVIHCAQIATNVTHFCAIANECIIYEAQSAANTAMTAAIREESDQLVCSNHKTYCISSDPRPSVTSELLMDNNRSTFCRDIMSCHKGRLISGPTVDVAQWCPHSRFCNNAQNFLKPRVTTVREPRHSCCMSCSCHPSCRVHHTCCFQSNFTDGATKVETLPCIRVNHSRYDALGFYMKNTCPNGTTCFNLRDRQHFATSKQNQLIYSSDECAKCNGADDTEAWSVLTICKVYKSRCSTIVAPLQVPNHFLWSRPVTNLYPWMLQYLCSDSAIRTCHPEYNNEAVIKSCHETNAIVLIEKPKMIFANIFCVACNFVLNYDPRATCDVYGASGLHTKIKEMTIMLDAETQRNAMKQRTVVSQHGGSCTGYTVKHVGQPGCRLVYCATGMVLMKDGSCKYSDSKWYYVVSFLHVSLHAMNGSSVSANRLRHISSKFYISDWTISPCTGWTADRGYEVYIPSRPNVSQQDYQVTEVVITLIIFKLETTPTEIIAALEKCFDTQWQLVLDDKHYDFSPSLYAGKDHRDGTHPTLGKTTNRYKRIYETGVKEKAWSNLIIHKLYFCDQIELHFNEFEEYDDNRFRLLHNNLTLGINEVIPFKTGLRVCVKDYLYPDIQSADAVVPMWSQALMMSLLLIQLSHFLPYKLG